MTLFKDFFKKCSEFYDQNESFFFRGGDMNLYAHTYIFSVVVVWNMNLHIHFFLHGITIYNFRENMHDKVVKSFQ